MSLFLWILQIVLAVLFLGIGGQRLTQPARQLRKLPWTDGYPLGLIRALGAVEVVAGLGLLLPGVLGTVPLLTPAAAAGLVVLMALAVALHLRRGQRQAAVLPAILLIMAAFVVWGRLTQLL
ncbi:DoxX family protein [Arthrobacter citreus]|jgi:hypothetical protein|uniref:DoxX family protein n=1 Tax=Arthrobacter citreus TaxID=1670 RepID=A0ABZ2ZUP4_9MICC